MYPVNCRVGILGNSSPVICTVNSLLGRHVKCPLRSHVSNLVNARHRSCDVPSDQASVNTMRFTAHPNGLAS